MSASAWFALAPLHAEHDRRAFDCGVTALDRYLREQASQDVRRRVATCFVACAQDGRIAGYYTLASASVLLNELPPDLRKKLPRYPTVPAVRLGRLAVDRDFKGSGLGAALLADALTRAARSEIAAYAMLVDAKDQAASAFYQHHGFIALSADPRILFLPLTTMAAAAGQRQR